MTRILSSITPLVENLRDCQLPMMLKAPKKISLSRIFLQLHKKLPLSTIRNNKRLPSGLKFRELLFCNLFDSVDCKYVYLYSPLIEGRYYSFEEILIKSFDSLDWEIKAMSKNEDKIIYLTWDKLDDIIINEDFYNLIHDTHIRWSAQKSKETILGLINNKITLKNSRKI